MNIKEAAERTGLSAHTIRFYERSGLFPKIKRTAGGVRIFSEADIQFLLFLTALKKTGLSLESMAAFTQDGCILQRLEAGNMPQEPVRQRLTILKSHQQALLEQQREIAALIELVGQKIDYYEAYLQDDDERETVHDEDGNEHLCKRT
ncbi:MerR family transcriptional regulator [Brevibacillus fluminis]|uniref:MerR family transcriptional regulator n=1 Tax=Brevibacillus fluminis TaxID=511487 RepID=A0A3M8CU40_9BACL|nr:MerR family transcriptional regulator [Brevibacillus fluminis]RNB78777.1 MerR family transcriptional regulator [Brevibacillus fluminis]